MHEQAQTSTGPASDRPKVIAKGDDGKRREQRYYNNSHIPAKKHPDFRSRVDRATRHQLLGQPRHSVHHVKERPSGAENCRSPSCSKKGPRSHPRTRVLCSQVLRPNPPRKLISSPSSSQPCRPRLQNRHCPSISTPLRSRRAIPEQPSSTIQIRKKKGMLSNVRKEGSPGGGNINPLRYGALLFQSSTENSSTTGRSSTIAGS